jgi:hypothetical protein
MLPEPMWYSTGNPNGKFIAMSACIKNTEQCQIYDTVDISQVPRKARTSSTQNYISREIIKTQTKSVR